MISKLNLVVKMLISCLVTTFCIVLFLGNNKTTDRATFGEDLEFLNKKIKPIILKDGEERQIIVSAEYQGRVLTSTAKGRSGSSYGWFNKALVASDSINTNRVNVGGAGRIWFGPDQGPNNIFFKVNKQTKAIEHGAPKDLDTLTFKVYEKTKHGVVLGNKLHIENLKGFHFYIDMKRCIDILTKNTIEGDLGIEIDKSISYVAFKTHTSMKNIGDEDWKKKTGLLSLWELGCFHPSPKTRVIIPLRGKAKKATVYFTDVDSIRLKIKNDALFYKADANYLNKIGTLPEHALSYFGSYSPELNLLTIVKFSFNDMDRNYVNSHPKNIENQYRGDVINVFNDGKIGNIGPFGPFYELETSSSAKALKIGEHINHTHQTYHFEGTKEALDEITKKVLNVDIKTILEVIP